MDAIQDWASYLLHTSTSRPSASYLRPLLSATAAAKTHLLPLLDRATHNPDLATIALVLVILFLSLKILNMLWQALVFWLRLARRVLFWGGLVLGALWLYSRGPEGAVEDVASWMRVWWQEYVYWKAQAETATGLQREGERQMRSAGWY